ncbi:MAG: GNAT family protein [Sporolactobacillus sp.]
MTGIHTDGEMTLRTVEPGDDARIFQLICTSREALRAFLPWVDDSQRVDDTQRFIRLSLDGLAHRSGLQAVICVRDELVGLVGFNGIDWTNKKADIGYWLGTAYEGRGLMTRAVRALTAYGFSELALNRIEIRAAVQNRKSRSVAERLGFVREGVLRQNEWLYDHYVDHVVYSMLASEWGHL